MVIQINPPILKIRIPAATEAFKLFTSPIIGILMISSQVLRTKGELDGKKIK